MTTSGEAPRGNTLSALHESRTATTNAAFFLSCLEPGMRLLDVGCGPGTITVGLAQALFPSEVVGVDLDAKRIELAQGRAADLGVVNVTFQVGNTYALPFPDDVFDGVFSHAVLEHLSDPDRAVQEFRRVLRSGGVVGISDTDHDGQFQAPAVQDLLEFQRCFEDWKTARGGDFFIGKRLKAILRRAVFEDLRVSAATRVYTAPDEIALWVRLSKQSMYDADFVAYTHERGIASPEETITRWAATVDAWGKDPDALVVQVRCEVVGWKPR